MNKGYVHVYTGNGKGKTTAALGLCLRAVCTGRYAPEEVMTRADLVTEMKEIKHYYTKGVTSRVGIEN